jgi:hypothetical protein
MHFSSISMATYNSPPSNALSMPQKNSVPASGYAAAIPAANHTAHNHIPHAPNGLATLEQKIILPKHHRTIAASTH